MKEINSNNNAYIKDLMKLKEHKYRVLNKMFLVEGFHLVKEAYNKHLLKQILFIKENDINEFKDIDCIKVNNEIIKSLSDTTTPQNIIGVCNIKEYNIDYKEINHVLILDNVNDPGNVGTLIRSALGFNIDLIILSNNSVDVYNGKVVRSTQGAIFSLPIIYRDLKEEISLLKQNNIKVIGTTLDSSIDLDKIKKLDKYAIILGNEANGIEKEIKELTDINVIIPINPKLESLNVSIAGAIVMYELSK